MPAFPVPELVTIFRSPAQYLSQDTEQVTKSSHLLRSPAQYLVLKEMRNKLLPRPRHPFMGRAELLDEIPVLDFQPESTQSAINPDMQTKRSAS